jgi:tripartite ATP-independent transporter DctP family solute receptor
MIKGVKVGSPEMFQPSSVMSSVEPRFGVFEMPYLITSRAQMKKVAESPVLRKVLFSVLPPKGMRLLAVWENGFRHITNSVRPISKPEDLQGIKLRVPGGTWRVNMFKAYGANPAPMPFGEVYAALQAGSMDGQENPFAQIASAKLQEVQKFLSLSGHVYSPAYLIVSEEFWKKVPADAQAVLSRTAVELGDYSRAQGEALDRELLGKVAPPLQVNEVDKARFIQASRPIYEQFAREVPGGGELVKLIESLR